MTLRRIRRLLGAVFFLLITLLFVDVTGAAHHWLGWMAKVQLLPAVLALNAVVIIVLVVLTLVFGRIYCSVICPLGVLQDVFAHLSHRRKKHHYSYSRALSWLRYLMLGVLIVAIALGLTALTSLLDPYGHYGRFATAVLQPIYQLGNNVLASIAESFDSYAFYSVDVWLKSLPVLLIAVAFVAALFVMAWRNGRTYCNTICPVGTVLGCLSRFSLMKIRFDEQKCKNCSQCTRHCKASCIDYTRHTVDHSRCVVCGNCVDKCQFGALSYGLKKSSSARHAATVTAEPSPNQQKDAPTDDSRRSFLLATALLTTAAMAQEKKKVDGGLAEIEDKVVPHRQTPITPPGAWSARNMARHCTGCQLCIAQCPNGVLRPAGGLLTAMQPTMSYERGYCRPECNRCSQVCPTDAIHPIALEEKASTQIGHAVWIEKNCVPLTDGVECGNCARHCPTGAIEMVPLDENDEESPFVPQITESRCIGCGACENLCPARPFTAIYVEGHEEHHTY
ncbi:MAG: 4Fe-4S binding protein [Bacteroidaceae bacterium]|nr:4Fe-4S binding protein [Bacteroidaceae bacterium]